ncbi:MAG: DUF3365 domain-containing protein [Pseudomonadales bacterium]
MKKAILLAAVLGTAATPAIADDQRLTESREIAEAFQQQLGGKLQAALAAGGPLNAIGVCSEVAPVIAARQSAASGAQVSRTALRVRNPDNAPDEEARAVLEDFRQQISAGSAMPVEYFQVNDDGSARFMKAIVLQPMCALCHGQTLAPEVHAAVQQHYPDDQATGFAVGELRGAFLIDWPAGG